jgi:probable rRNA maturation factor
MAQVEVDNRCGESAGGVDEPALVAQAQFLLARLGLHPQAELAISLVEVDEMAALHEQWLDLPGPTDVLSFPMDELRVPGPGEAAQPGVLGDVVLCPAVAAEQGAAAGHGTTTELELLLTHGILHLLGHDHAEPEERAVMFALQDQLLAAWRGRAEVRA